MKLLILGAALAQIRPTMDELELKIATLMNEFLDRNSDDWETIQRICKTVWEIRFERSMEEYEKSLMH